MDSGEESERAADEAQNEMRAVLDHLGLRRVSTPRLEVVESDTRRLERRVDCTQRETDDLRRRVDALQGDMHQMHRGHVAIGDQRAAETDRKIAELQRWVNYVCEVLQRYGIDLQLPPQ